jgi:uncharacterized protein YdiU (UPF0061 family)
VKKNKLRVTLLNQTCKLTELTLNEFKDKIEINLSGDIVAKLQKKVKNGLERELREVLFAKMDSLNEDFKRGFEALERNGCIHFRLNQIDRDCKLDVSKIMNTTRRWNKEIRTQEDQLKEFCMSNLTTHTKSLETINQGLTTINERFSQNDRMLSDVLGLFLDMKKQNEALKQEVDTLKLEVEQLKNPRKRKPSPTRITIHPNDMDHM